MFLMLFAIPEGEVQVFCFPVTIIFTEENGRGVYMPG